MRRKILASQSNGTECDLLVRVARHLQLSHCFCLFLVLIIRILFCCALDSTEHRSFNGHGLIVASELLLLLYTLPKMVFGSLYICKHFDFVGISMTTSVL